MVILTCLWVTKLQRPRTWNPKATLKQMHLALHKRQQNANNWVSCCLERRITHTVASLERLRVSELHPYHPVIILSSSRPAIPGSALQVCVWEAGCTANRHCLFLARQCPGTDCHRHWHETEGCPAWWNQAWEEVRHVLQANVSATKRDVAMSDKGRKNQSPGVLEFDVDPRIFRSE